MDPTKSLCMAPPEKKVSWAPGTKLRQMQFVFVEDPPSFGLGDRDRVDAKSSLLFLSTKTDPDIIHPVSVSLPSVVKKTKPTPKRPAISWRQPQKFALNPHWLVAEGGESQEIKVQNERQMRIPEVTYASSSYIPHDPFISPEARHSCYDDAQTPLIPITEIEEEVPEASLLQSPKVTFDRHSSGSTTVFSKNQKEPVGSNTIQTVETTPTEKPVTKIVHDVEPDVAAAASVVFTAIVKSSDKGSLVDRELLVKILSDPKMIEKLAAVGESPMQATLPASQELPGSAIPSLPPSPKDPLLPLLNASSSPIKAVGPTKFRHVPLQQSSMCSVSHRSQSTVVPLEPHVSSAAGMLPKAAVVAETPSKDLSYYQSLIRQHGSKDVNYYKSLIRQHGGDEKSSSGRDIPCPPTLESDHFGNNGHANHAEPRIQKCAGKSRFQKPCAFFGSAKGCKRGGDCLFQHNNSLLFSSQKRIRLDKGITESI